MIFPSGSYYCTGSVCGYFFWGAHAHDAIWHLAITAVSFNSLPFLAPTFSGENLYGYNYLLALAIYFISKIGVSPLISYFKILPIVWFFIFTYFGILVGRKIKDSPLFVSLLLFFFYFGGSFSYFLSLYHDKTIWGSSGLLSMQSGLIMTNLQFAFSLILLLVLLKIFFDRKLTIKKTILISLLVFLGLGLKFYGGLIMVFMTGIFYFDILLSRKKIVSFIPHAGIFALFASAALIIFYNPFAALSTGSVLSFSPLSTVRPIIEEKNLFYLQDTVNARYFLLEHGIGPRLIMIETITLFLFLLLNLGTRFLGMLGLLGGLGRYGIKNIKRMDIYLLSAIVFSTLMTVLFVQKGQWWNTIQFFYYAIFLSSFFAARFLYEIMHKKNLIGLMVGIVFIILTLPTSVDLVKTFSSYPSQSYLPKEEIIALNFLKKQPEGVVFVQLPSNSPNLPNTPNPLYSYADNAYVTAFSGKKTYFADIVQLQLTGVNYQGRLDKIKKGDCSSLKEADYYYQVKTIQDDFLTGCYKKESFRKIYENNLINIYELTL